MALNLIMLSIMSVFIAGDGALAIAGDGACVLPLGKGISSLTVPFSQMYHSANPGQLAKYIG